MNFEGGDGVGVRVVLDGGTNRIRIRWPSVVKRKYEQDEEYRKKRLAEAKRYWMKKRRAEAIDARRIDVEAMNYEPDSTLSVLVSNSEDIRAGMTVMVPVYRPSSVAKLLGRSVQTLRLWGLKELIPEVTYRAPGGRGCIRKTSSGGGGGESSLAGSLDEEVRGQSVFRCCS